MFKSNEYAKTIKIKKKKRNKKLYLKCKKMYEEVQF